MSKETKPEMTVEEFTERWCLKVIECMKGDDYIIHDKEECRADLNSVIRGKLIAYDNYLARNRWGLREIATPEQSVDEFLKDNQ